MNQAEIRRGSAVWLPVVACLAGTFIVIWGLLKYLRGHDYKIFMIYRLAVAALVFGLIIANVRSATV